MGRRFIDLSTTLGTSVETPLPVQVRAVDHFCGARQMSDLFQVPVSELPQGLGWAGEELTVPTHAGTHMDSPWHYGPLCEGRVARTIDEVPLEWCFAPGVVLDLRQLPDGSGIDVDQLRAALNGISHELRPGEIVLLWTGAELYADSPDYCEHGVGLLRDSTLWLVAQGIRIIGTDAWGLDRPFRAMRSDYARSNDASVIWPAHFAGREREYCQLERLRNLEQLPPDGFTVACFPVKLQGMSAGWVRGVAILEE